MKCDMTFNAGHTPPAQVIQCLSIRVLYSENRQQAIQPSGDGTFPDLILFFASNEIFGYLLIL